MKTTSLVLMLLAAATAQAAISFTFWDGSTNPNGTGNIATNGTVTDNGVDTVTETLAFGAGVLGTSITGVDFRGFTAMVTQVGGPVPTPATTDIAITVRQGDNPELIRFQVANASNLVRTINGALLWETAESGQSANFNEIKLDFATRKPASAATGAIHAVVVAGGTTYVSTQGYTGFTTSTSSYDSVSIDANSTTWQAWDFASGMNVTFGAPVAANTNAVSAVGVYVAASGSGSTPSDYAQIDLSKLAVSPSIVPEPSTVALVLGMLAGIVALRRRQA